MPLQTTHKTQNTMEPGSAMRDVRQFHDLITCGICHGYMVDPTTVDDCYHTYCRSCILKQLLRMPYCPECKLSRGKEISEITEINLRSDDILRALIYKLVPGLYHRECREVALFEEQHKDLVDEKPKQEFFTATELVSLSLEYNPAMLHQCGPDEVPPIIYLQCAAGLSVELLKRFLRSKNSIEADNKLVEVEVTYEDEVLPDRFTLMDVGYCYSWSRQSPMAFCYRILLYESERAKNEENNLSRINQDIEPEQTVRRPKAAKSVTFAEDLESEMDTVSPRGKARTKTSPKTSPPAKGKRQAKKEADPEPVSTFKSLRSNDMRFSDYAVPKVKSEPEPEQLDHQQRERDQPLEANANIVVSIPPSQLSKSYGDAESFELKTANRKGAGHLPRLKIELNSMKSKLSMPLSAHGRLEDTASSQQLDLETYAKNIGLKPIEQPSAPLSSDSKYSPNASPMSSCSSSTNGSTGSLGTADASTSTGGSSHRKRKKKHSKEPKDANGKRKKLHAEISSQTDGKMKVKITSTPKHKMDLKRSHSIAGGELALQQLKLDERSTAPTSTSEVLNRTLGEEARSISSLVVGGAPTPPPTPTADPVQQTAPQVVVAKPREMPSLPTSPPLPPSLFKSFTPTATPAAAAKPKQPSHQPQHHQHPTTAAAASVKPPLSNNNNRKPPSGAYFAVPQAPGNTRNLYHMQRYLSTPSSIASAANKQPKRSLSLDESHPAKQARLHEPQSLARKVLMGSQVKAPAATYLPNPQPRLYGPEMAGKSTLPLLCPTSLSLPSSSSSSVTITPRPRNNPMGYPFPEPPTSHIPALEIVRLGPSKQAGPKAMPPLSPPASSGGRLMGPPAALPKMQAHSSVKMPLPLPLPLPLPMPMPMTTIPTIVKSPPLSVALSGQRGNCHGNKGNNSSHNAAYRTSPPALINLRNTGPHSSTFPSKSQQQLQLQQQQQQQQQQQHASLKTELNSKKSAPAAASQSKTNGTAVSLDKSKTSLREFRPAVPSAAAKDADILDLSANPGRSQSQSHSHSHSQGKGSGNKAPTSPPAGHSSSNSLEAALNKIKQNISANSNGGSVVAAAAASSASASSNANGTSTSSSSTCSSIKSSSNGSNSTATSNGSAGDDLQNLHMLSESATAREKISIKAASYENKPKNANALVRPQNASMRSIPNPSALAFRNQPAASSAGATASSIAKPLTVRAEERPSKGATGSSAGLLSPTSSSSSGPSAATSPRGMTKKPTTIDQVAANLNIRAEAKAAALAEEAPPVLSSRAAKSPELAKTSATPIAVVAARPEPKEAAVTVSAASTLLSIPGSVSSSVSGVSSVSDSLPKPPVQIAATDTLAPVASSA